ncbi:MAG: hypothetical protein H6621_02645 [Halobacteriovoraceae bacterium]|nr:hypothetical protein [Halobacteriovoraceae bacterium]MCB9093942.1 hypothetical protein [Halobacteriovoraceae bacterium]
MKKLFIYISFISLFVVRAMACVELEGVSLFAEDTEDYTSVQTLKSKLYEQEFYATPALAKNLDYEDCKDTKFTFEVITATKTGKTYVLLYSSEDSCDGGNPYGGIFNENMDVLGDIEDAYIYCYEK